MHPFSGTLVDTDGLPLPTDTDLAATLADTFAKLEPKLVNEKKSRTNYSIMLIVVGLLVAGSGALWGITLGAVGFVVTLIGVGMLAYYRSKHTSLRIESITRYYYPLCFVPYVEGKSILIDGRNNIEEIEVSSYEMDLDKMKRLIDATSRQDVSTRILPYEETVDGRPRTEHSLVQAFTEVLRQSEKVEESSITVRAFPARDRIAGVIQLLKRLPAVPNDSPYRSLVSGASSKIESLRGFHSKVESIPYATQLKEDLNRKYMAAIEPLDASATLLATYGRSMGAVLEQSAYLKVCSVCGKELTLRLDTSEYLCGEHGVVAPVSQPDFEERCFRASERSLNVEVEPQVKEIERRAEEQLVEAGRKRDRDIADVDAKYLPADINLRTTILQLEKDIAVARKLLGGRQ